MFCGSLKVTSPPSSSPIPMQQPDTIPLQELASSSVKGVSQGLSLVHQHSRWQTICSYVSHSPFSYYPIVKNPLRASKLQFRMRTNKFTGCNPVPKKPMRGKGFGTQELLRAFTPSPPRHYLGQIKKMALWYPCGAVIGAEYLFIHHFLMPDKKQLGK